MPILHENTRNRTQKYTKISCLFVFLFVLFGVGNVAEAASLYINPPSGTYSVGENLYISIRVSSTDQAINAVQGVLSFPASKLAITDISKAGSIMSLWVQEPGFDNVAGTAHFEGVVLNPGFTGAGGRVLTITFRVKAKGMAGLVLSSASVLANDGKGTEILSNVTGGNYILETKVIAPRLPTPEAKFIITSLDGDVTDNPRPKIQFEVRGLEQTIDHYNIRIDKSEFALWIDDGAHIYTSPTLDIGKHIITVRAYYTADKFLESSISITINALEKPKIIDYPRQLRAGDTLIIKGKTYPESTVTIFLQKDIDAPIVHTVKSDKAGEFAFIYDKRVTVGVYSFWASVEDMRGAKSEVTEKYPIAVQETAIIRIGSTVINTLTVLLLLLLLIVFLAFVGLYSWYRLKMYRRKLNKEVEESESSLHKAFKALRKDVEEQLEKLEKAKTRRELTNEEKAIRKTLLSHLDIAERFIEKEIRDVKDELYGKNHK